MQVDNVVGVLQITENIPTGVTGQYSALIVEVFEITDLEQ